MLYLQESPARQPTGQPVPAPVSSPQNHRDAERKRVRRLGALVIIGLIIAVTSACSSVSTPSNSKPGASASHSKAVTKSTAPSKSAAAGASALPIQNGDWRLDSIRLKNDGLGSFSGAARVTYTGKDSGGGSNIFTLTVFKKGKDVAVLQGGANSVAPGKAVTVQFISSDKFVAGPYTYDFQNDL